MTEPAWSVRVHSASAAATTAFVRQERIPLGEPLSFDPAYRGVTALEHVLAGVGADIVGCVRRAARRQRVDVDDLEAVVDATLENALTYLGVVGEEGAPRVERVHVTVYVSSQEEEERLTAVWDEALLRSPMASTLGPLGLLAVDMRVVL